MKTKGSSLVEGTEQEEGAATTSAYHHCGVTENDASSALSFWCVPWDPEG